MKKSDALYCLCRRPDDYKLMLQCSECEDWFHAACVNISETDVSSIETFTCPRCNTHHSTSVFVKLDDILPENYSTADEQLYREVDLEQPQSARNVVSCAFLDSLAKFYPNNRSLSEIATCIENALFSLVSNNEIEYRKKFRSLLLNLRDPRNKPLRDSLLNKSLSPTRFVQMRSEELAPEQVKKEIETIRSESVLPIQTSLSLPQNPQDLLPDQSAPSSSQTRFSHEQFINLFQDSKKIDDSVLKIHENNMRRRLGVPPSAPFLPVWAGSITLPGESECSTSALFHSVFGPQALAPEIGRLSHFNLPTQLSILGRIDRETAMSYIQQASRLPTRAVAVAQLVGPHSSFPENLETTISHIHSNLLQKNRLGVIFSALPPPAQSAPTSYRGWYIKDLYVAPLPSPSQDILSPLDLDAISLEVLSKDSSYSIDHESANAGKFMFLVFVLARMPPDTLKNATSFSYKSISSRPA